MTVFLLILVYVICVFFSFSKISRTTYSTVSGQLCKKKANIIEYIHWFLLPLLIFIVVTRPDTLPDIIPYRETIQYYLNNRWEPSFNFIRYIGWKTSDPVGTVFLIYAILSVTGRVYYIKKISPFFWGSMVVYIGYYFIYNDMIQIRAAVATMLLYPIMISARNRKFKRFTFLVFLSTLFHYSSIVYFVIYLLNADSIKKWQWIGVIFICYALAITGLYITPIIGYIGWEPVNSLFIHYYSDSIIEENVNIFNIVHLGQVFCALFMLFIVDKIKYVSPFLIVALKIFVIGLCIKTVFSDLPVVANRSSELFTSIEVFLIPTALYGFFKKQLLYVTINILYSLILFTYSLITWF